MKPASHRRYLPATALLLAALLPSVAMAHPGHGVGQNLMAGMLHPLGGIDHVLMIVAVSAWAGALSFRGRMVIAGSLAAFVAVGSLLPFAPAPGRGLEAAIALTVLGSGVLLAMNRRWPLAASAALAAGFALIHGFAHGAEGPAGSLAYVPGLALATGGLALAVSFLAAHLQPHRVWLRIGGLAGAAIGATALFVS
jgi:urease accessory protein